MRTDDGEVLLENWANGFFGGMQLALDAWRPFITDPETAYPLALLIGQSTQTGGPSLVSLLAEKQVPKALADTWRVIPELVTFLYDRCADARKANSR